MISSLCLSTQEGPNLLIPLLPWGHLAYVAFAEYVKNAPYSFIVSIT